MAASIGMILFLAVSSVFIYSVVRNLSGPTTQTVDVNSLSNFLDFTTDHFHLDLYANFTASSFQGSNTLTIRSLRRGLREIWLDIRSLDIYRVTDSAGNNLRFTIESDPSITNVIGSRLRISLQKTLANDQTDKITIYYSTHPDAKALSWLAPENTVGKMYPYTYSQCQPIYCRTLAPLQDSPAIKSTYTAAIKVDKPLAVHMSANLTEVVDDPSGLFSTYKFEQTIKIPSYLLAIVAGNLAKKQVSFRTGVVSEPEVLDTYVEQLKDMESYLKALEGYLGAYDWGVYNVVVLPPNFIYGGMENPLLTFVCFSILYGDKMETILHEMAHSWTGNLVTCKNWQSFWINEGFDKFMERKGDRILMGEEYAKLDALIYNRYMEYDINSFGLSNNFTSLTPQLLNINPDDAFSTIPYEKGFQFLTYLESLTGEEFFRQFIRAFIARFREKSADSHDFQQFFIEFVKLTSKKEDADKILQEVDWETWLRKPGLPPVRLNFTTPLATQAGELVQAYIEACERGENPDGYEKFDNYFPNLKVWFLELLADRVKDITPALMGRLHRNHPATFETGVHAEILLRWYKLCINVGYEGTFLNMKKFLATTGRMKYVRPIYKELYKKNKDIAISIFRENESFYHPIAATLIRKDLHIN